MIAHLTYTDHTINIVKLIFAESVYRLAAVRLKTFDPSQWRTVPT